MQSKELIEFPKGLALIATGFEEIKGEPPLKAPLDAKVTLKVPKSTKFVHVGLTAMDMTFRSGDSVIPSAVSGIWFEIIERNDKRLAQGEFKFRFRAVLQNAPTADPTGDWNGIFWVEFLCFG